jgi:hypothetical protein
LTATAKSLPVLVHLNAGHRILAAPHFACLCLSLFPFSFPAHSFYLRSLLVDEPFNKMILTVPFLLFLATSIRAAPLIANCAPGVSSAICIPSVACATPGMSVFVTKKIRFLLLLQPDVLDF